MDTSTILIIVYTTVQVSTLSIISVLSANHVRRVLSIQSLENDTSTWIVSSSFMKAWFRLSMKMKSMGYNAPIKVAPDFLIKLLSLFDPKLKEAVNKLGYDYSINCNQAHSILDFNPIKLEKTIEDTHNYLNELI